MLQTFLQDDEGATAIEYSLIASLIALAIIGAVVLIGNTLSTTFTSVSNHLTN